MTDLETVLFLAALALAVGPCVLLQLLSKGDSR